MYVEILSEIKIDRIKKYSIFKINKYILYISIINPVYPFEITELITINICIEKLKMLEIKNKYKGSSKYNRTNDKYIP